MSASDKTESIKNGTTDNEETEKSIEESPNETSAETKNNIKETETSDQSACASEKNIKSEAQARSACARRQRRSIPEEPGGT